MTTIQRRNDPQITPTDTSELSEKGESASRAVLRRIAAKQPSAVRDEINALSIERIQAGEMGRIASLTALMRDLFPETMRKNGTATPGVAAAAAAGAGSAPTARGQLPLPAIREEEIEEEEVEVEEEEMEDDIDEVETSAPPPIRKAGSAPAKKTKKK
jgi:hypothetical protein